MSELGALLELLHGAGRRWDTVRLIVRQWQDSERTGEAVRRHAERQRDRRVTSVVSSRGHGPHHDDSPSTWETETRAWIDRAGNRSRVEGTLPHGGELLHLRVGRRWWSYTPSGGAMSNEHDPEVRSGSGSMVDHLLDPSPIIAAFDFTVTGTDEVAGRPALLATAIPRPDDPRRGFGVHLALGADDLALAVDRERGVLLRTEAHLDGRPFNVHEVTDIAFDEPFDDELFRFEPPDGSGVRSPRETYGRPEWLSIEEAARRASFTVLVPTRLPEGWTVEAFYVPPWERPRRPDAVNLELWARNPRGLRLQIHQTSEPLPDRLGWETVERDGRQILVYGSDAKVHVEGTHARLTGNVDRDTLIAVAASLRPAPTELPPLREC